MVHAHAMTQNVTWPAIFFRGTEHSNSNPLLKKQITCALSEMPVTSLFGFYVIMRECSYVFAFQLALHF